ncbi:MAG TPA: hypothetical protein VGJ21_15745 [Terracidiphilus sp.]
MAGAEEAQRAHAGQVYEAQGVKRAAEQDRVERQREKQTLQMQRENILSQRTSNPGRRSALEAALKQIEEQIAALDC